MTEQGVWSQAQTWGYGGTTYKSTISKRLRALRKYGAWRIEEAQLVEVWVKCLALLMVKHSNLRNLEFNIVLSPVYQNDEMSKNSAKAKDSSLIYACILYAQKPELIFRALLSLGKEYSKIVLKREYVAQDPA